MGTWLVTGANRGIGLELCRQLVARGERVIAACRTSCTELAALGIEIHQGVDVTSDEALVGLAHALGGTQLDVLVLNAGVLEADELASLDFESLRHQFEVNTLGPLRTALALRGTLAPGSKVAIVTSLMGSLGDNESGGYYGYRMSKAAVNVVGVNLAHDLRELGVAVVLLHPGMVATRMTGHRGIAVEESARGLLARIDELTLDKSGTFRHQDGRELPW
ncbi:MAG: SDR family oxidoreductase [Planctomycetes bacterium]|nr:SDR family oxidoreductase [Planctomycetota bacterium]